MTKLQRANKSLIKSIGNTVDALIDLQLLRGPEYNTLAELAQIESQVAAAKAMRWSDLLHLEPEDYKPILVGSTLVTLLQFSGLNAVMFNAVDIFAKSGSSLDPNISSVIINLVQVKKDTFSPVVYYIKNIFLISFYRF